MASAYDAIRDYVFDLDIIDTHEHLPPWEKNRLQGVDVLAEYLRHYFSCDLVSAGLSDEGLAFARDPKKPLMKRWKTVAPYWDACRNTGYARSLDIAVRELYGIERIDGRTLAELNEKFLATLSAKHYDVVLKQKARIRISIEDHGSSCVAPGGEWVDFKYFRPVFRCGDFTTLADREGLGRIVEMTGVRIHTLEDLEHALDVYIESNLKRGAIGLKSGLAYLRTLRFDKAPRAEAEKAFITLVNGTYSLQGRRLKQLHDYLFHRICRAADERGLPFQIHTGLQEGNGNVITNSDPALLVNLFMEYPNARFDIFHIGYPYQQTLAALAKNFRNVFIDFCWANIISPEASIRALIEYLDAVPANKISGFGGDYCFIDGVVGHAYIARENVAKALAFKVKHGSFDLDRAKQLAKMILNDNPERIFNIRL